MSSPSSSRCACACVRLTIIRTTHTSGGLTYLPHRVSPSSRRRAQVRPASLVRQPLRVPRPTARAGIDAAGEVRLGVTSAHDPSSPPCAHFARCATATVHALATAVDAAVGRFQSPAPRPPTKVRALPQPRPCGASEALCSGPRCAISCACSPSALAHCSVAGADGAVFL